ncbi:hypothetical protein BRD09_01780, partial [Halobacteriales archaeon SW_10_68_16]
MRLDRPLKLGYGTLVLKGLLAAVAPRKAIVLVTAAWRLGFENVGDLQPLSAEERGDVVAVPL